MFNRLSRTLATVAMLAATISIAPTAEAAPKSRCDDAAASQIEYFGAAWVREVTSTEWVMTDEGIVPGPTNEPGQSSPDLLETWEQRDNYGNGSFSGRLVLQGVSCPSVRYRATVHTESGAQIADLVTSGNGATGESTDNPFVVVERAELDSADYCVTVRFTTLDKKGAETDFAPAAGGSHTICDDGVGGFPYLK